MAVGGFTLAPLTAAARPPVARGADRPPTYVIAHTSHGAIGSVAPAPGFPSSDTTGVPVGTQLRVLKGDVSIGSAGAVLRDAFVFGCVQVTARRVTIVNVKIICEENRPALRLTGGAEQSWISNVEIDGAGISPVGLEGKDFTANAVNVYAVGDGVHLGSATTLENSFVHDLAREKGVHNDDLQTAAGTTGSNITVLHNSLEAYSAHFNGNSSYHLGSGDLTDVGLTGNYMDGGSATIQVAGTDNQSGILITRNAFGRHYRFTLLAAQRGDAVTFEANVWANNGRPATLRNSRGRGYHGH